MEQLTSSPPPSPQAPSPPPSPEPPEDPSSDPCEVDLADMSLERGFELPPMPAKVDGVREGAKVDGVREGVAAACGLGACVGVSEGEAGTTGVSGD